MRLEQDLRSGPIMHVIPACIQQIPVRQGIGEVVADRRLPDWIDEKDNACKEEQRRAKNQMPSILHVLILNANRKPGMAVRQDCW